MEIELPNGVILDAPDDADPSVVAKAYLAKQKPSLAQSNPAEYDSSSPEYQAKYGPLGSNTQNFMAGAGKSVVDLGRGLKQIGLQVAQPFRKPDLTQLVTGQNPAQRYQQTIDESKRQDAPLMDTKAGIGGSVAGTLATLLLPAGGVARGAQAANLARTANVAKAFINPATLKAAAAGGALQGALQPVGTDESRLANAALGAGAGIGGQALAKGVGAIAQPIKNVLSGTDQAAVKTLSGAGVPLDAAQQTGSQRAMQVKRFLTDNPLTAPGQTAQFEKSQAGFNKAALATIGESADAATKPVMSGAKARIGKVFDDVATRNPIQADQSLLNDLVRVGQGATSELERDQAAIVHRQIDEVIDKAQSGQIDGKAYQNIKTTLDRITLGGNKQVGYWAAQLRESLDNALQRSANPADYEALMQARSQWRNLKAIASVVGKDTTGNISPAKLANKLNVEKNKNASVFGRGQQPLVDLAQSGSRILPERMPNSGTAPRAALQLLLPGAVGAGYGYAKEGDLSGAAAYGAGGLAAPFVMQRLLNQPGAARYLSQGLQGPMRGLLNSPATQMGLQQAPRGLLEALQQ